MERFIVREPRGEDYIQGNPMIAFSPSTRGNIMVPPETIYFGGYGAEIPNMQQRSGIVGVTHHLNFPYASTSTAANQQQPQGQMMSGNDRRYLAVCNDQRVFNDQRAYSAPHYDEGNATFITGQRSQMERERPRPAPIPNQPPNYRYMDNYYQSNNFAPSDRHAENTFTPHNAPSASSMNPSPSGSMMPMKRKICTNENYLHENMFQDVNNNVPTKPSASSAPACSVTLPAKAVDKNTDALQKEVPSKPQLLTRADKLKALQRSGPRAFSGPVEKVVKWHKALQDIGVLVLYEIVAKCVSVRPGEGCAKNLVVRDDNGPAMQVVYYEVDFRLLELKVPCTIRVIGRMQPGTCRLQAFNVRVATSDDVATISRRAAIAAHHVAKLCKEYGPHDA